MEFILSLFDDEVARKRRARSGGHPHLRVISPPRSSASRHLLICEVCRRSVLLHREGLGVSFDDQVARLGWHEVGYAANHDVKRQWCPDHQHIGVNVAEELAELGE